MTLPRFFIGQRQRWFFRLIGLSISEALVLFTVTLLFRELLIALDAFGPDEYLPTCQWLWR